MSSGNKGYSDLLKVVESDFNTMDQMIFGQLNSKVKLVMAVSQHVIHAGGKRMRPLMGLLAARALRDEPSTEAMKLAAITEMLHTATLVHDDVIDSSNLRRGEPTANATWDNPTAVLVGDYLIARAFNLLVEFKNLELLELFSAGTCDIAEGEVLQLQHQHNPEASEEDYLAIILGKTSRLFMLATEGMCLLFDQREHQQTFSNFSRHFGNAFQMVDDILDYASDSKILGKNVGDDIAEGKPTLPMIRALSQTRDSDPKAHQLLSSAVSSGTYESIDAVIAAVKMTDSLKYCRERAIDESAKAISCLEKLPASEYVDTLKSLTQISIDRIN